MPDPVRYGSLPFAEAIAYLRDKIDLGTEHWDDIEGSEHDRNFVVAGAAKADLLCDLHAAVLKGAAQGTTLAEFMQDFESVVAKAGWTGWTGEDSTQGRAWRAQTIFETNLRTGYQAGRRAQHMDEAHLRPYLEYHHADGAIHPRPLHLRWDGTILPIGDPWIDTHYTPNGWGCRCYWTSLAQRDMDAMGRGPDQAPEDGTWTKIDRYGVPHELPMGIDYGWDHAPGATRDLVNEVKAKAAGMPAGIKNHLLADLATSSNGAILSNKRRGTPQAPTAGDAPMTTIYQDDRRTLSVDGPSLGINSRNGKTAIDLDRAKLGTPSPAHIKALKAAGEDPAGWYALQDRGATVLLPPQTRPAIDAAIDARRTAKAKAKADAAAETKAWDASLDGQRAKLVRDEYNSYSADAFPGSPQWRKNKAAADALRAFDAAHPEIAAKVEAARKADERARYDGLSDFVKSGS